MILDDGVSTLPVAQLLVTQSVSAVTVKLALADSHPNLTHPFRVSSNPLMAYLLSMPSRWRRLYTCLWAFVEQFVKFSRCYYSEYDHSPVKYNERQRNQAGERQKN